MSRSGIGAGSASIVLVFAVLCLTIFSLITFVVAGNDKALVDAKAGMVTGYYNADTLAELILSDILSPGETPGIIRGVPVNTGFDESLNLETTYFFCDISETKALYVNLVLYDDSFDILSWRMYDKDEWEFDDSIIVWTGE